MKKKRTRRPRDYMRPIMSRIFDMWFFKKKLKNKLADHYFRSYLHPQVLGFHTHLGGLSQLVIPRPPLLIEVSQAGHEAVRWSAGILSLKGRDMELFSIKYSIQVSSIINNIY